MLGSYESDFDLGVLVVRGWYIAARFERDTAVEAHIPM